MIKSNKIFFLFLVLLLLSIVCLGLFCFFNKYDLEYQSKFINVNTLSYQDKIFDDTKIHKINILIEKNKWNRFIDSFSKTYKTYLSCDILIDDDIIKNVGIRPKGGSTFSSVVRNEYSDKYSLKIKFDEYIGNQTYYGLDSLELNNQYFDKTYMADYFVYDMMRFMEVPAPYVSYAEVYINNEFIGFYTCIENVDEAFLKRNYGNNYGNLYKPQTIVESKDENNLLYIDENVSSYQNIFDSAKTNIDEASKKQLVSAIKNINNGSFKESVNLRSLTNYFVVHNFSTNADSYFSNVGHNYYLYEKDGILEILPWDYDLIFMVDFDLDSKLKEIRRSIYHPDGFSINKYQNKPLWYFFINDEENLVFYEESFHFFIKNYFDSGYFENKFNKTADLIKESVKKDFLHNNFNLDFTIEKNYEMINFCKTFFIERASFIKRELNGNLTDEEKLIIEESFKDSVEVESDLNVQVNFVDKDIFFQDF